MAEQRFDIGRGGAQKMFFVLGALSVVAGAALLVGQQYGMAALLLLSGAFMVALAVWMPGTLIIGDDALTIERRAGTQRFAWSEISSAVWSSAAGAVPALASDNWVLTITGLDKKQIVLSGPMVGKRHAEVRAALSQRFSG